MSRDINLMTREQLTALHGMSEESADAIIARRRISAFTKLDELAHLPAMNREKIKRLKEQGLVCAAPIANGTVTFACCSCGRNLPLAERETMSRCPQDVCITCFVNVISPWNMLDGA